MAWSKNQLVFIAFDWKYIDFDYAKEGYGKQVCSWILTSEICLPENDGVGWQYKEKGKHKKKMMGEKDKAVRGE